MPTINVQVSATADDGTWLEGVGFLSTFSFICGYRSGGLGPSNGFCRFNSVTLPAAATITAATIDLVAGSNQSATTVNLLIRAVAADNPAAPTTYAGAEGATRTTASVAWSSIAAWTSNSTYSTPDISSVIQELVNRGGWASGNSIVIYIEDNGSSTSGDVYRDIRDYGAAPSSSAILNVTYSTGSSSGAAMHYYRQCQRHEQPRLILPDRELITELPPRFNRLENRLAT